VSEQNKQTTALSPAEKRALLAQLLQKKLAREKIAQGKIAWEETERARVVFPLSWGQQALWFLYQLAPDSSAYNMAFTVRIRSQVNVIALQRAFQALLERHPMLRTTFRVQADVPVQEVHSGQIIALQQIDATGWDAAELAHHILEESHRPFALSAGPVLRVALFTRAADDHVLLLTIHHIVADAWSVWLLLDELRVLYAAAKSGAPATLPPLNFSYQAYVAWQRDLLAGAEGARLWAYWQQQLANLPVLALPTDRPRPAVQTYQGAAQRFTLGEAQTQQLKHLAQAEDVTLYMLLLAAFQVLLHRYTGQAEIVIGSPTAGRSQANFAAVIGYFVNPVVLRTQISGAATFKTVLAQVRQTVVDAITHQAYPFPLLVERLQPTRDPSRSPLFQVTFMVQQPQHKGVVDLIVPGAAGAPVVWGELQVEPFEIVQQEGQFDLTLDMLEAQAKLSGVFNYNTDLFDAATIQRMAAHFQILLAGICANPAQSIGDLPLLKPTERQQLLVDWNATQRAYPQHECIHQLFEAQVARTPEAVAVDDLRFLIFDLRSEGVDNDDSTVQGTREETTASAYQSLVNQKSKTVNQLTYRELNERANQLAHHLQMLGVGPETRVGICVERSLEMMVGLLAILKAGGAYVPLDPSYPKARLAFMIEDSQLSLLLTQQQLRPGLPTHNAQVVCLDSDWPVIAQHSIANPVNTVTPDNLAYVIYTSGSTGTPKGVLGCQRGVVNRLHWMWETYPFATHEIACQKTALSFVDSVAEIFSPLLQGVPSVIIPDHIVKEPVRLIWTLAKAGVTRIVLVPSLLRTILETDVPLQETLPALKYWATSGEALSFELFQRFQARLPHAVLLNFYGSSEVAADATWCDTQHTPPKACVPLGRPLANTQLYLLDAQHQPVPLGVPGALYVGGVQIARGYLNRPDLTAEQFIPHPFSDKPGSRLYRTGDLARYCLDGQLEFVGRADHQVKIRGFRIELGEVEATLHQHPAIQNAVVIAQAVTAEDSRLIAYVVLKSAHLVEMSELRRFVQTRLPEAMTPAFFMSLDVLPLTPSGKLDRRALPTPMRSNAFVNTDTAPRTTLEKTLGAIWCEVLKLEQIGIQDNFFAVGGHSLLATQVIARIRVAFALDLPLSAFLAAPTVAGLAQQIQARQTGGETHATFVLPQVIPAPDQRDEPFPLTDIQQAYWLGRNEVFELGNVATHAYFELESNELDIDRLSQAWQQLIERHAMLRAIVRTDGQQQVLAQVPTYTIAQLDLSEQAAPLLETHLANIRSEMSHQILAADRWPLFDIRATKIAAQRWRLHVSLDSLLLDGSSLFLLFDEWYKLYRQPHLALPRLELSFRDYVLTYQKFETTHLYQQAERYWFDRLDQLPPAPELPLARNPQTLTQPHFERRAGQLDAELWQSLKQRAGQAGLTPSALLMAAFAEILTTWSKNPHFVLNLTLFNRLPFHPQVNEILGDFTPLLLLTVDNRHPGESFVARAQRLQQQLWQDLDHRAVNGVRVLRELARRRGAGMTGALMPVVFTSLLTQTQAISDFQPLGEIVYSITQTPQVWLDHQVREQAGALVFNWDAVDALFPPGLLDEMFTAYCALIERLARQTSIWTEQPLALAPAAQLAQRALVNATAAPLSEALLHTLFLQQVPIQANKPAVITPERQLTYAELYEQANGVGHWLRQHGARPNTLVAVVMEKSWAQIVAVLGIHLAGAAYLPIDPSLPTERQHYLLKQGEVRLALTQSGLIDTLVWPAAIEWLAVDGQPATNKLPPLETIQKGDDLAYVIYTSGSTGLPKGVAIDHRGAVNTILDINRRFGVTAADRVLALSALNFDLSVYDIFGPLAAGGAIVLPSAALRTDPSHWQTLMMRHRVTIWNSVPALMQILMEGGSWGEQENRENGSSAPPNPPTALRLVMLSGDWIPITLPGQIQRHWPDVRLYSLGGATEASIWSIFYPITALDPSWTSIPYGKPLTNQTFHVFDDQLNPRPVWTPGHLYIGGVGLAQGYWRDAEKTQASFIFHPHTGERLYKTGDLGRYLPDGNLEFLGRADFQVKIRGHRIELGEIEAALLQHPGIKEAVVNAIGAPQAYTQLVAYVVLHENKQNDLFVIDAAAEQSAQILAAALAAGRAQATRIPAADDRFLQTLERFNQLYVDAVCQALATLGLYQTIGEQGTLDELMRRSGIVPRYRAWLQRALLVLVEKGWLRQQDDEFVCVHCLPITPIAAPASLALQSNEAATGAMFMQTAQNLAALLTEQFHSAEIYAAEAMPDIYQALFADTNALVKAVVQGWLGSQSAPLRILEVGAGYGSTTAHLLPILPTQQTSYCFSDISEFFLQRARKVFADYPFLRYAQLNLETAPEQQGYQLHSFDLIIASSVLHVPRQIEATLAHVRSLLAPGGLLVMIEETAFQHAFDLGMGLQQGFERFADQHLRPLHPLLSRTQWQQCLTAAGFGAVEVVNQPGSAIDRLHFDVIVAQGPAVVKQFDPQQLTDYLAHKLPNYMVPTNYIHLDALPLSANGKVDRKALPLPTSTRTPLVTQLAPRTPLEAQIAAIWREVLPMETINIEADFFASGGDSLIATQVITRLRQTFQIDLPLRTLFEQPTIAALAATIEAQELALAETATMAEILAEIERQHTDDR